MFWVSQHTPGSRVPSWSGSGPDLCPSSNPHVSRLHPQAPYDLLCGSACGFNGHLLGTAVMQNQEMSLQSECPANPPQPTPVGPWKRLQPPPHLHSCISSWYVAHFLSRLPRNHLPRAQFQQNQSFFNYL